MVVFEASSLRSRNIDGKVRRLASIRAGAARAVEQSPSHDLVCGMVERARTCEQRTLRRSDARYILPLPTFERRSMGRGGRQHASTLFVHASIPFHSIPCLGGRIGFVDAPSPRPWLSITLSSRVHRCILRSIHRWVRFLVPTKLPWPSPLHSPPKEGEERWTWKRSVGFISRG